MIMYPLLEKITEAADVKHYSVSELERLAKELREFIVETVAENGGHLAPSLGTVELTLALYSVFNFPKDKLIWDVGHQAYSHKILTAIMFNHVYLCHSILTRIVILDACNLCEV